jgi:hypothetical protein
MTLKLRSQYAGRQSQQTSQYGVVPKAISGAERAEPSYKYGDIERIVNDDN